MPSPRPTTLQPGDRAWARRVADGSGYTGTVATVSDDGQRVAIDVDNPPDGLPTRLHGPAADFHPLYDLSPDVMAAGDVCAYLGRKRGKPISYERLRQLRARIDFPTPATTSAGEVWDGPAIRAWDQDRGRQRNSARTRLLASYRKHGTIHAAAKSTGTPYTTARRWLGEAGALSQEHPSDG